ncbi:MAG: serine hydrolase domain-containing protein [Burkholderiaceae bacterium]|nr:serine hydrolase domain-containing protein [Burkholderiaceae bacterium]
MKSTRTSSASAAASADAGLHPERAARLLAVLQSEIDSKRLPGAVAMIVRHGKVALFESLGQQNPADASSMALDSIFRIYSMTKPIVSVAVLMLMEQGKLLLSDPVSKYLPEYAKQQVATEGEGEPAYVAVSKSATVQDLLRHTAGLTYEFLGNSAVQKTYRNSKIGMSLRDANNAEFSKTLAALPLQFEPGTMWEYSRATDVLGALVEAVSGQTLGDFLSQHIFNPLGMLETGFSVPPENHHRLAEPFKNDPDGGIQLRLINVQTAPKFESGGGGLASTAHDYARFLQFMLNKGELDGVRLLGSHTVDFMTADHLGDIPVNRAGASGELLSPGHGFGLGFAVRKETGITSVPGSAGLYFWGGIAGTTFFVDPKLDMFAILMIQAPNQRDYYRPLFRNLVYAALAA